MSNLMTRRAALAASAAVPLVSMASSSAANGPDPAVEAYKRWLVTHQAWTAHISAGGDGESPEGERLYLAWWDAGDDLANAQATTIEGLIGQLELAAYLFADGELVDGKVRVDPDAQVAWADGMDVKLIEAMRTAARGIAEAGYAAA